MVCVPENWLAVVLFSIVSLHAMAFEKVKPELKSPATKKSRTGTLSVFNRDSALPEEAQQFVPPTTISAWIPIRVADKCCNAKAIVNKFWLDILNVLSDFATKLKVELRRGQGVFAMPWAKNSATGALLEQGK